MRIVGGRHRGRPLIAPAGQQTRPTSDRARQAIFNILEHGTWHEGVLDGAVVLDVFAGTGALGLEALSRGATRAAFIENDRAALTALRANIDKMGEAPRATVLTLDAARPGIKPAHIEPATLIFLDPPYGKGLGAQTLKGLAEGGWLAEGAVCVLEMSRKAPEEIPSGFCVTDERTYGVAKIMFLAFGLKTPASFQSPV